MVANPYEVYKQQSIMTMTQGEMLNRLYEEAIKQLTYAQMYIAEKDYNKANEALQRAQRIFNHLDATLDSKYDISANLSALYDYFIQRTITANIKKTVEPLEEIIPMVEELRESFLQADKAVRKG